MSCESSESWPWLMVKGKAEIVGAASDEFTVTVGCVPSILRSVPPPLMPEVAVVFQVVNPAEAGAIAVKVNMMLSPVLIGAPPVMAVKNIVPFERLEFHDEGGARITIGS